MRVVDTAKQNNKAISLCSAKFVVDLAIIPR